MPTQTLSPSPGLTTLFDYLDSLTRRATVEEMAEVLRRSDISIDDVIEHVRFLPDRYARNLIRRGPWYQALALCWRSGQRSPIHDHRGSTCGVRVLKGRATETVFEPAACGQVKAVVSREMGVGEIVVTQDADIHQMSNLEPAGRDLVTLHIYSPPLEEFNLYSITDGRISTYREGHLYGEGGGI